MSTHHSGPLRGDRQAGTMGQQTMVTTNSLSVTRIPTARFQHYDAFEKPYNRRRSLEIIDRLQLQNARLFNPRAAYDGKKNMFRSEPIDLPGGAGTFKVYMGGAPTEANRDTPGGILVKISRVAEIDTSSILPVLKGQRAHSSESLMTITLLNVLIRMAPIMTHPSNARAFFTKEVRDLDIGMGLELWRGFFQSVRPSMYQLTVNVDIATAVMYQGGSLLELVKSFLGLSDNRPLRPDRIDQRQRRGLENFLKGLLVYTTQPPPTPGKHMRLRPIQRVVMEGASNYRFEMPRTNPNDYPEELTITEYFMKTHQYKVILDSVICIGFSGNIVYPIEVLEVKEGQIYKKTLPSSLAARALKFAAQKPHQRLSAIEKSSRLLGYADSDYIRRSGMAIDARPLQIPGRILPPPTIQFGKIQVGNEKQLPVPTEPKNGSWNLLGKRLFHAAKVPSWAVINFAPFLDHRKVWTFVSKQKQACVTLGMMFPDIMPPILNSSPQGNLAHFCTQLESVGPAAEEAFKKVTGATRPTFVLVILPDSAITIKRAVKHWGDCLRGCPTQCMKAGKLVGANDQYHNNLALKINAKIGGVNSIPSEDTEAIKWLEQAPTMIVGADVSHAAPGSQLPSITGLVSSVDLQASRYVAFTSVQESRVEIIEDLETMIRKAAENFISFQKEVHKLDLHPRRVIFYRDGVSEGQFEEVAREEVRKVKRILAGLPRAPGVAPCKLTFIIVGKKHHVRFFPKQGEGDKSGNCLPGLVIDEKIVNPVVYDFYLQSHGGLLGTSRSSHYVVIEDENRLDSNTLQGLSYTLCHVYARATRSVSIPAPVYYADIVCARGAFHSNLLRDGDDGVSVASGEELTLAKHRDEFLPINENVAKFMYFM